MSQIAHNQVIDIKSKCNKENSLYVIAIGQSYSNQCMTFARTLHEAPPPHTQNFV